ncbi:MAG: hypothetical protein WB767_01645 [Nocardioides sp.]
MQTIGRDGARPLRAWWALMVLVLTAALVPGLNTSAASQGGTTGKITLTPREYIAGETLTIKGNVGRSGKRTVVLQRFMRDKYLDEGTGKTDAQGNFSFTYPGPGMATPFSIYVPSLGKRTPQAPVAPKEQEITLDFNPVAGLLGLPSKVVVSTFPVRPGRGVELQRRLGGSSWERIGSAVTDKAGRATFTVQPPTTGNNVYRVMAAPIKGKGVSVYPSFPTYHFVFKLPMPVSGVSSAVAAPDKKGAQVALTWTTPDDEWIDSVVVARNEGAPGTSPTPPQSPRAADRVQSLARGVSAFTDTQLTPGAPYAYTVFTMNGRGDQAEYAPAHSSAIITTPTQPVVSLVVDGPPAATSVPLRWTPPGDPTASGIVVVRADGTTPPATIDDGLQVAFLGRAASSFTDVDVMPSSDYAYAVFVTNKFGTNSTGPTVMATTPEAPPESEPAPRATSMKGWW